MPCLLDPTAQVLVPYETFHSTIAKLSINALTAVGRTATLTSNQHGMLLGPQGTFPLSLWLTLSMLLLELALC